MINNNNYPNIQVTDDQVDAFCIWAINKYNNYMAYYESIDTEELVQYIRRNILSNEMQNVLLQTDMYVGIKSNEPHITSLQIYRQNIIIKMNYIQQMLGKQAFAEEVATRRAYQEQLFQQRYRR